MPDEHNGVSEYLKLTIYYLCDVETSGKRDQKNEKKPSDILFKKTSIKF